MATAKEFTAQHPGALDEIKWVLYDMTTLKAYTAALEHWEASEFAQSPDFYVINRMLRDGGV